VARPLGIEFPGAVDHVTSCGDRREDIFVDDEDRKDLLAVVAQALSRFDAEALAYRQGSDSFWGSPWLTALTPISDTGWSASCTD